NEQGTVVGRVVFLKQIPVRIVGVTKADEQGMSGSSKLELFLPYTTVQTRMTGSRALQSIAVRIRDTMDPAIAEKMATAFLQRRHGKKDFFIFNSDTLQKTIQATTAMLALLVASISGISLF